MNLVKKSVVSLAVFLLLAQIFLPVRQAYAGERAMDSRKAPTQEQFEKNLERDITENGYSNTSYQYEALGNSVGSINYFLLPGISGTTQVRGAIPQLGKTIGFMISQPPASAEVWLADVLENSPFLAEKAYAQGVGFKSMTPILPIWKTFRDLSYIGFIFVFVGIGFMIMFRQKLGGQAAVTVSTAIPKLVTTLILITFSYAIAGFVIDLMYILIYFIAGVFTNLIDKPLDQLVKIALTNNIFGNGLGLVFSGQNLSDLDPTTNSVAGAAAQSVGQIIQGFFGTDKLGTVAGTIAGTSANIVGFLIIAVAIFFAVCKTFFELLKSYVSFVVMVIFSPFQLLLGVFKDGGDFSQWFRNLVAALIPFPVVIVMIFLAMAIGGFGKNGVGFKGGDVVGGFQPPQLRIPFVKDAQGGAVAAVQGLVVIGLLMLIPESVELSKKWLKASTPFDDLLPRISKNLEMGWKGGQVVPGIGPTVPGISKLLPGIAKVGTSSLVGGAGGMIGGAALGVNYGAKRGHGTLGQVLYGAGGAMLGGGVGAGVGASAPAISKIVEVASPRVQKAAEFAGTADKAYEAVSDIFRARSARKRAEVKRTPPSPTATSVAMDTPVDPNG